MNRGGRLFSDHNSRISNLSKGANYDDWDEDKDEEDDEDE
jgi:hypothetical protein